MIGMSYEQIVERIKQEKNVSEEEISKKVQEKLDKLSDLISKEGAAHIVANELGVNLYQGLNVGRRCKIKELMPSMRNVEVLGKVVRLYDVRTFNKNGREGKIGSFLVGDETGMVRIVIWDENLIKEIENGNVKEDSIILVKNAYVRENNGFREVHLGSGAALLVDPEGETVGEVSSGNVQRTTERKTIAELKEGDNVTVYGTLVNVFEPRFYNACPECNKKVLDEEGKFKCAEHGEVVPKLVPIVNIFLDDGTDNIRVVFFREAAGDVLKVEKIEELKDNPEKFRKVKEKIMLEQLEITGRVNKNEMFDRLEMNAFSVKDADPKEIAAMLEK